jgi:hypothetical protein
MVRPSSRQSFSLPCCVMQANHLTSLAVDTRAATQDIRRSQWTRSTLAHILTAVVLRLVSLGDVTASLLVALACRALPPNGGDVEAHWAVGVAYCPY